MEDKLHDGQTLKQALKAAELFLEKHIEEINSLNVFPVPDGDTGINMYLTLQAANANVENLPTNSVSEIASRIARGALLGARGNSGVILSQILRGLARGMETKDRFSTLDFALAMHQATETAYKAIANPVEGTILTVIREASEVAAKQAEQGAALKQALSAIVTQARDTVEKTPEMLPQLKAAGVVDAGGKGLYYLFLGMKNSFSGNGNQPAERKTGQRKTGISEKPGHYGFDTQFLIEGEKLPVEAIRTKVNSMGDSVLVVGDENLIRVHIHTHTPQAVMDYCSAYGTLIDVISVNMDDQVKEFEKKRSEDKNQSVKHSSL